MEEINILGDVAGQYDALVRLVAKMPKAKVLAVGDLIDRGEKSREVIEWFLEDQKNRDSLFGNHEDLMLSSIAEWTDDIYGMNAGCWLRNGGRATMKSYGAAEGLDFVNKIPKEHTAWISTRAKWLHDVTSGLFVSHAALSHRCKNLEEALENDNCYENGRWIIWSRDCPIKRPEYKLQVFGHNSGWGLCWFYGDNLVTRGPKPRGFDPFAVCLDDSKQKVLTGLHYPSLKVYQEAF